MWSPFIDKIYVNKMGKDVKYVAKTIHSGETTLLNICDRELVGSTVKGGAVVINLSHDYFGSELVDAEKALQLIKVSNVVNLVGNRIISKVIQANLASELAVKKVGSTSFLMIFKFHK